MRTKSLFLCIAAVLFTVVSFAQSQGLLKPYKNPYELQHRKFVPRGAHLSVADSVLPIPIGDSVYQGVRWTGLTALYAYQFAHGAFVSPGALVIITGLDYEHSTYTRTSGRWYTDWGVGGGLGYGAQGVNGQAQGVLVGAVYATFLNKHLVVGLVYNFNTREPMAAGGPNGVLVPNN